MRSWCKNEPRKDRQNVKGTQQEREDHDALKWQILPSFEIYNKRQSNHSRDAVTECGEIINCER